MGTLLILLVDDDDLSLEVISLLLQAEGYRLTTASSGQAAIEVLSATSPGTASSRMPDVVLTDFQMPDMSGQELCRRIRAIHTPGPLLIGMSATVPPEDQLQEFDAFVSKPFNPQTLQEILTRKFMESQAVQTTAVPPLNGTLASAGELDMTVVEKLRKLMPGDAIEELYATYLSDTRLRLVQLEEFASAGDAAAVRRCAHMMKGSAAMTGAVGISRIAALLEAGSVPLDQQRTLFHDLRCACDAIEGTLARDARNKEAHDHQIS